MANDRLLILEALEAADERIFLLIVSAASGLLQTYVMEHPDDLPVLDAVLAYLRTHSENR